MLDKRQSQTVSDKHQRGVQRDVGRWQSTRRLRRNRRLAAIMALVGLVAEHRTAALHALLIMSHREHAVGKLHYEDCEQGQHH